MAGIGTNDVFPHTSTEIEIHRQFSIFFSGNQERQREFAVHLGCAHFQRHGSTVALTRYRQVEFGQPRVATLYDCACRRDGKELDVRGGNNPAGS